MLESLEAHLSACVAVLKFVLDALSAACVGFGLLSTLRQCWRAWGRPQLFSEIRLHFGTWLALALELQLGADIVGTTVAPSFEALGKLGLIAVVRTFLNYFLQRELEAGLHQPLAHPDPVTGRPLATEP